MSKHYYVAPISNAEYTPKQYWDLFVHHFLQKTFFYKSKFEYLGELYGVDTIKAIGQTAEGRKELEDAYNSAIFKATQKGLGFKEVIER